MITDDAEALFDLIYSNDSLNRVLSEFGIFAVNYRDGRVIANQLFKQYGYGEEDMSLDHDWANNIHPEDKAHVLLNREQAVSSGVEHVQSATFRYRKHDGDYVWLISSGRYLSFDQSGEPDIYIGCEKDITSLKESEQKLKEATAKAEKLARESDVLLKIGATISSSLNLDEIANVILLEIRKVVDFDAGIVFLKENDMLKVLGAYCHNEDTSSEHLIGQTVSVADRSNFYSVIATYNKSLICNDIEGQFPTFKHMHEGKKSKSIIGIPLTSKGKIVGILKLGRSTSERFSVEEYDTISKFSDNIAIALENALLHEQVSCLAQTDTLTQVNNRHGLSLHWKVIAQQVQRHPQSLSVMIVDIDWFKRINDTYGHDTGDAVIKGVARVIVDNVRESDVVARFGGEEFVVVLPGTALTQAHLVAEKVKEAVKTLHTAGGNAQISVSIGIADNQMVASLALDRYIQCADEQLYKAKANGRDTICPKS